MKRTGSAVWKGGLADRRGARRLFFDGAVAVPGRRGNDGGEHRSCSTPRLRWMPNSLSGEP